MKLIELAYSDGYVNIEKAETITPDGKDKTHILINGNKFIVPFPIDRVVKFINCPTLEKR